MQPVRIAFLALSFIGCVRCWSYTGALDGPDNWGGACPTGEKQSPINLPESATRKEYSRWSFQDYGKLPTTVTLTNNGHTAVAAFTATKGNHRFSGGGLAGTYEFAQFHFHWGVDDTRGSEHTISGEEYPLELHLVHYNTAYGSDLATSIAGGGGAQDTLAVLGIMFEVVDDDNDAFNKIINGLADIKTYSTDTTIENFRLESLLPSSLNEFWRYEGSLTTPDCNEIVMWTVFKTTVGISSSQLAKFRELTWKDTGDTDLVLPLIDTYRPVQPLNSRSLYLGFTQAELSIDINTQSLLGTFLTAVGVVLAVPVLCTGFLF